METLPLGWRVRREIDVYHVWKYSIYVVIVACSVIVPLVRRTCCLCDIGSWICARVVEFKRQE
jgi:hypothetical protein